MGLMEMNKKGIVSFGIFKSLILFLLIAIFLGISVYTFSTISGYMGQDIEIGQVNLGEISNQTLGVISSGFVNSADTLGIVVLLSMCILMLGTAYFSQGHHKIMIVVEIFIIIFTFVGAVYISNTYNTYITAFSGIDDVYSETLHKTSKFVLTLPIVTIVIGALMIILSYGLRRKEEINVLGY